MTNRHWPKIRFGTHWWSFANRPQIYYMGNPEHCKDCRTLFAPDRAAEDFIFNARMLEMIQNSHNSYFAKFLSLPAAVAVFVCACPSFATAQIVNSDAFSGSEDHSILVRDDDQTEDSARISQSFVNPNRASSTDECFASERCFRRSVSSSTQALWRTPPIEHRRSRWQQHFWHLRQP